MESEKCRVLLCAIDKGSITAAAETWATPSPASAA